MESKGTLPAQPDLDKRLKRLRQLWLPSGLRRPLALAAVAMLSSSLHLAVFFARRPVSHGCTVFGLLLSLITVAQHLRSNTLRLREACRIRAT
jgi:hypothetical protein